MTDTDSRPPAAATHGPLGTAPPALCAGTHVLTPGGPVAVEALAPGDAILAADGAMRRVHWIGLRTLRADLVPEEQRTALLPVGIPAGAFGPGLPARVLRISPGTRIHLNAQPTAPFAAEPPPREGVVRYFAIETDVPSLFLAEGVAVETYRDHGDRNAFANVADWTPPVPESATTEPVAAALVEAEPAPIELTAAEPIAPESVQADIDADGLTGDPGVHLIVDGRVVAPDSIDDDTYRFMVPARTPAIRLASRSVVPAEIDPSQGDRRRLGVGLRSIRLRTPTLEIEIGPEEDSLAEGFYPRETGHRWTDGLALLPPRFYRWIVDPCEVEIRILKTPLRYPFGSGAREAAPLPVIAARTDRKRALVIDACTPTPDRDAGSNVTLWHMRLLRDLGYDVTFVPQDNFTAIPGYTPALHALGIETVEIPAYSRIEPFLRARGASFDLAYVHRFAVAESCLSLLRAHAPRAPVLFNNADLHYLRLERAAALTGAPEDAARAADVRRRELAVIAASDVTILCNTVERDLVAAELPGARLAMLPWVIEARAEPPPPHAARRDVMFLGGFGHPPNGDAVHWFVASVLPILRRLRPEIRLHVYGSAIPDDIAALASDGVVIGGHVPDLRPVFDRHLATIAPLRYGAGFKGKIAEALAAGIPTVATPVAVEGSGLRAPDHLLVAESAPSFAMAIARLEADPSLWDRLSQAGLAFARESLSPEQGRHALKAAISMAEDAGKMTAG